MTKMEEILDKLRELSEQGKITWKPTAGKQTFAVVLDKSSVLVSKWSSAFEIKVLNESGEEIERVVESFGHEGAIQELYETARRSALDVSGELDGLLVELNQY